MVGDHAAVMIADAWSKGIRGFDIDSAYRLIRKNALDMAPQDEYIDGKGRRALNFYMKYGYIPLDDHIDAAFHKNEQVSRTLEYTYDDAMIALLAESLGHKQDAALFRSRGENWRNVMDTSTGLAHGRYSDGSWVSPFYPTKHVSWITEGTPFQYTFFVPQNIPGLMSYMGGRQAFLARLDESFAKGYDDHGNEPGHHIPYLYALAGQPEKAQKEVRSILDTQYKDGPGGLAGNDDAGQMSAWDVMSSLGFYQVCPGVPLYTLGSPRFDDITVALPHGRRLRILAPGAESGRFYTSRITLNGRVIRNSEISHTQLMRGGTLRFAMSADAPSATTQKPF